MRNPGCVILGCAGALVAAPVLWVFVWFVYFLGGH